MAAQLQVIKPNSRAEKVTHTTVDTIAINPALVKTWKMISGQRPLKENKKVIALAEQLKTDGGVLPGIITIGILGITWYLIDGQHRLHAFKLSGLMEGYCDVRFLHGTCMGDLNKEFRELNSHLANMRPDDFLRAMEESTPALKKIRTCCPFVAYGAIRRNSKGSSVINMLSMSATLRTWRISATEVPGTSGASSAVVIAEEIVEQETDGLIKFLTVARAAFGCEPEYWRLWGTLNLTVCMWLYRRMVITQHSPKTPRLENNQFEKCLLALSANSAYLDFLVNRKMSDKDRMPTLNRVKSLFTKRLEEITGRKVQLPAPNWG